MRDLHIRPITHVVSTVVLFFCLNLATPARAQTCVRPAAGLAGWWPLDETVGSVAADIIGGSDGALIGTTSVAGKVSGARRFGPDQSMTADGSHALNITGNQITIEAWIKLETAPTASRSFTGYVGKTTFPSGQAYQIVFETGPIAGGALGTLPPDRWRFEYILANANGTRVYNQETGIDVTVDGKFHHFAMVYDGSTVRLYVDAVLHGAFGFTGNLLNAPAEPLKIFGTVPFAIDDVGVYSRALSPAEIKTIVCASSAQPTPSQLVFTSNRDGDFDLHLMDDDGSNVVQLTNHPAEDMEPAWSPDGQRIAFASNRDGDFEIFVMKADGTDVVQVTHTDASARDRRPKWSPDGRFLVFQRPFEPLTGRHTDLYQVELATGIITRLTFVGPFGSGGGLPDWAPDSRIIDQRHTDGSDWELFVRETNGSVRQLTFNSSEDLDPDWFTGGTRAAFTSSANDGGDIRMIVLANGTQTALTTGPATDGGAAVSCDGSRIAFHRDRALPSEGFDIWVMAADGAGQVNISNHPASDHSADWRCPPPDSTSPMLALPDTVTVEATGPTGAVTTYSVSAADDEDPNPTLSCTPPSGSTFPIGESTVTCTATDASANTATGSFTVIVRDTTPPVIEARLTPAPNANGWNNTDVTIDFFCTDAASGVWSEPADLTLSLEGLNQSAPASCQDAAGNTAALTVDGINIDKTPPVAIGTPSRGPNANGWYNQAFALTWSGHDGLSGIDVCGESAPYGGPDTAAGLTRGECADRAGNVGGGTFAFRFDATPPTIAISEPTDGATFLLRQIATASYTCGDGTSGVAGCTGPVASGAPLDTNVAGTRTFTVTAMDVAGNTAGLTHQYSVAYGFEGFFAPLNNLPTTNRGPAGRTFPVKFALRDASGAFVGDPAAIISVGIVPTVCGAQVSDVDGEEMPVDTGGLKYDAQTGVWHFNWQTTKSHAGCWVLELRLADGSGHAVAFELR